MSHPTWLEYSVRRAIEQDEFVLHYQPILSLKSLRVTSCEALIRWRNPHGGLVGPREFIPQAEKTGLIVGIGEWVFREVCRQVTAWRRAGVPIAVSVNVSPRQIEKPDFLDLVSHNWLDAGLPATSLQLELTESTLARDTDASAEILHQLRARGVRISIDDFGTGYSTFVYLHRFPVSALKIDRVFLQGVSRGEQEARLAAELIAFAHGLNMGVVFEGVEEAAQLKFLQDEGCDEAQGYFISPPLEPHDLVAFVAKWNEKERPVLARKLPGKAGPIPVRVAGQKDSVA